MLKFYMKSEKKNLLKFFKEIIVHSTKMLFANKIRFALTFFGVTCCVILLTFTALMAHQAYAGLGQTKSMWPENSFVVAGSINKDDIDKLRYNNVGISCNNFVKGRSYSYNDQIRINEVGVDAGFLSGMLTDNNFQSIFSSGILYGRDFSENEIKGFESSCMIFESMSLLLFNKSNSVGETLKLWDGKRIKSFSIIAIIKDSIASANNFEEYRANKNNELSLTLYTTYANTDYVFDSKYDFSVVYSKDSHISLLEFAESDFVSNNLSLSSYSIYSFDNIRKMYDSEKESFSSTYIPFLVVLIIGEIVILVLFLMFSMKERVSEIGVRKAIGAEDSVVALQFIVENGIFAVFSTTVGCLVGTFIYCLYVFSQFIGKYFWIVQFSLLPVLSVFLLSISIITLLSIIPYLMAKRIKIVNALRFE